MDWELAIHGESGHHTPENSLAGKFNTGSVLSFPLKLVHSGGFSIYLWRFSVVFFSVYFKGPDNNM